MGLLVLVVAFMAVACGGGSPPPPPPPVSNSVAPAPPDAPPPSPNEPAIVMMRQFTDEMCACTTAECAKHVSDRLTEWSMKMAREAKEPLRLTETEQKRAADLGNQMAECMMRATSAPPTQPQPAPSTP